MWLSILAFLVLAPLVILAAMIVFGTSVPPAPMASIKEPFRHVDFSDVPPIARIAARDGTPLAVRVWPAAGAPADVGRVVIAIHGSSAMGSSLHPLAKVQYGGFPPSPRPEHRVSRAPLPEAPVSATTGYSNLNEVGRLKATLPGCSPANLRNW